MHASVTLLAIGATLIGLSLGVQRTPAIQNASAGSGTGGAAPLVTPSVQVVAPLSALPIGCAMSVRDQFDPSSCVQASTVATQGLLFPYPGLNNQMSGTYSFVGGGSDNQATNGSYANGHTVVAGGDTNTASGDWSSVVGGQNNTASGKYAFVGGGANNLATNGTGNGFSVVVGGSQNVASGSWSVVGGGQFNSATQSFATIGGGSGNLVNRVEATIAGGSSNSATGIRAAIGGGSVNTAVGYSSTVAGGTANFAVGRYSVVGGGKGNLANFNAPGNGYATASGGRDNNASGAYAAVGGGGGYSLGNVASGAASTVPGGQLNSAQGNFSFAAGRRAKATHTGSFVWGDSQNVNKGSSTIDEFNVYASGGTRIFSDATATNGVLLAPGGGSWSSVSDRATKENLIPVAPLDVLERVLDLPISTWNYITQDDSIRHIGPMAQDFHAAFGVGASEKTIDTIDPDGVALAAIQGLNQHIEQKILEKDAEIARLRDANAALEERVARLERLQQELAASASTPR